MVGFDAVFNLYNQRSVLLMLSDVTLNTLLGILSLNEKSVCFNSPCLKYKKKPVFADEFPKLSFLYSILNGEPGLGAFSYTLMSFCDVGDTISNLCLEPSTVVSKLYVGTIPLTRLTCCVCCT